MVKLKYSEFSVAYSVIKVSLEVAVLRGAVLKLFINRFIHNHHYKYNTNNKEHIQKCICSSFFVRGLYHPIHNNK